MTRSSQATPSISAVRVSRSETATTRPPPGRCSAALLGTRRSSCCRPDRGRSEPSFPTGCGASRGRTERALGDLVALLAGRLGEEDAVYARLGDVVALGDVGLHARHAPREADGQADGGRDELASDALGRGPRRRPGSSRWPPVPGPRCTLLVDLAVGLLLLGTVAVRRDRTGGVGGVLGGGDEAGGVPVGRVHTR